MELGESRSFPLFPWNYAVSNFLPAYLTEGNYQNLRSHLISQFVFLEKSDHDLICLKRYLMTKFKDRDDAKFGCVTVSDSLCTVGRDVIIRISLYSKMVKLRNQKLIEQDDNSIFFAKKIVGTGIHVLIE